MYTREEVYEATLKYFEGDELASNVWIDKYCLKNDGKFYELTPDDMHRRLAKEFARIEAKYPDPMSEDEIYYLLQDFAYIVPQGSPMAGIGNPFALTSISNCFVIGGHVDSYGGIHLADQEQSQIMKRRGGAGQDISWLRPAGAIAGTTPLGPNAGTTLYMDRFSNTTREVQQDGRRGALMLSIDIKHPDTETFIDKKMKKGSVTGANVSVKISDEFMQALERGDDFYQTFPISHNVEEICTQVQRETIAQYNELNEGMVVDGQKTYWKKVDPKKIWDKIVHNAWAAAEPGILFWDKILSESPGRGYGEDFKEVGTNPCGEIPLPPNDSCRLLVVNLMGYVFGKYQDFAMLEDTLLVDHVKKAQRLMDDIVDLEIEKIDKIIDSIKTKKWHKKFQEVELELWSKIRLKAVSARRTGLGITAEGDLIAALGYKYGTPEASLFSEKLHQLISTASYESSIELAKERGAFPLWEVESDSESEFLQRMFDFQSNELMSKELFELYLDHGRRNIANLTIAPTGSVSILTQTSSGIEPIFAPWYFRKKKLTAEKERVDFIDEMGDAWTEFPVFHKPFISWFSVHANVDFNTAKYHLEGLEKEALEGLFKVSPWFEATAQDVDYVEKVRMQGAVQKWVDHSISVTVNMPEDTTEDTVASVYREAHISGCKGITVYRDNSRGNVLSTESVKKMQDTEDFDYTAAFKRPKFMDCDIFYRTKAGESYFILVGLLGGKPYELFSIIDLGEVHIPRRMKTGRIVKTGRGIYDLINDQDEIVVGHITSHMIESEKNSTRNFSAMLRHRMNPKYIVEMISKYASISSFHKVVAKVLTTYVEDEITESCPSCGDGKMIMKEGCMTCQDCGYAHCG